MAKLYGIILLACPVRGSERVQGRRHKDTLNVLSDQQAVGENYNMIRSGGLIIIWTVSLCRIWSTGIRGMKNERSALKFGELVK